MNMKSGIFKATLSAAVVLIGAQAYANTQAFFARTGNFTFTVPVAVPLTNGGATQVTFTGSGRRTITYTAECSNNAANTTSYVTIAIVVDGIQLAPTGNNTADAFCTSDGTSGYGGYVMTAAQGRTGNLADGTHTVQILASLAGGAGWLGDSALDIAR